MEYRIYTDGSYHNSRDIGGYAAIVLTPDNVLERIIFETYTGTNSNRMELMAIIKALETLAPRTVATIYTDSRYSQRLLTNPRFIDASRNKDLYYYYNRVITRRWLYVTIEWVAGHSGNKYNALADNIANSICKTLTPKVDLPRGGDIDGQELD